MLWQRILAALRPARGRVSRTRNSGRNRRHTSGKPFGSSNFLRGLEPLEARELMAADLSPLAPPIFHPTLHEISPVASSTPTNSGLSVQQIRHAYGMDQVMFGSIRGDGTGQTIAIIDAYHSPTITQDLHAFDVAFGLPDPPSFRVVAQDGSTHYPSTDPSGRGSLNWETETALDVEWAHAMAPGANLLLIEAVAPTSDDLIDTAVDYARRQLGVSAITMSFGSGEYRQEVLSDGVFHSVAGHGGVTFLAASGDSGAPPIYPAVSPNVVAVGGTRLSVTTSGNYVSESGWSGSGGGISQYESRPGYQDGLMTGLWRRGAPDVAFDADPVSGVPVYDSYNFGTHTPWIQVGGTSFSSPAWAGIIAVANQGRALAGLDSLDGATQTLPLLYSLPSGDFHDVVTGSNGLTATAGYDLVTGRGTPIGGSLIVDMANATNYGNGGGGGSGGDPGGGSGGDPNTPPVNDGFAAATEITGTSVTAVGWNIMATQEAGEPNLARVSGGHSVWWTWKATASGSVVLTTRGSDFDTTLGVFTGNSISTLTSVGMNDDESTVGGVWTSRLAFNAVAGTTYRLAVDGYHAAVGNILLQLDENVPPPPPANDSFAARTVLTGASASAPGQNVQATVQSGEPRITGNKGGHSVWWSWTAPANGKVTLSTAGSDFDTLLGVYTGTAVNKLMLVAVNDDQNRASNILSSKLTFQAVKGKTYQIVVDGYNGKAGNIALSLSQGAATNAAPAATAVAGGKNSTAAAVDQAIVEMLFAHVTAQGRKTLKQ